MNGPGVRDRLLRVAPLMLRLGVAAVLAVYGVQEVGGLFGGQADEHAVVNTSGVNVTAGWDTLLGVGALGMAGLLTLGLLTRLATLGVLGGIAVWAKSGLLGSAGDGAAAAPVGLGAEQLVMLLLAAVCASLLVSGCGCLGLDCRLFGRKKQAELPPV